MNAAIHYSELKPFPFPGPLDQEWETYRREVAGFLAEGREGKHVLIFGDRVVGFWDSREEALAEGYQRYWGKPFLVHQVKTYEPLLRAG